MRKLLFPLMLAPLAVAADRPDRVPPATPTGPTQNCIPIQQIRQSLVRSDSVIDFVMRGRDRVYRVTLPQPCPRLGFEERFSYETTLSQLCAQDIITVLSITGPPRGASCGLAPFQPVSLAKGAR